MGFYQKPFLQRPETGRSPRGTSKVTVGHVEKGPIHTTSQLKKVAQQINAPVTRRR